MKYTRMYEVTVEGTVRIAARSKRQAEKTAIDSVNNNLIWKTSVKEVKDDRESVKYSSPIALTGIV